MKFELIEKFVQEREQLGVKHAEMKVRRDSALEEVHALKAQYEAKLRESLKSGKDAGPELDKISTQIDAAERTFKHRDREFQMFSTVIKPEITAEDILAAWNGDFIPTFKAEVYEPALDALMDAKLAYLDAYASYKAAVKKCADKKQAVLTQLAPSGHDGQYRYKMQTTEFNYTAEREKYTITRNDVYDLENGLPVRSIQHVKRGDE